MSSSDLFWQDNWKKVVGAFIAIVIAILLVGAWMLYTSHLRSSAEALYSVASTPEQLREVIKKYPYSVPAGDAHLRIATSLREEGKLDEAISELDAFLAANQYHPLAGAALLSLGEIRQMKNDKDSAIEAYRLVAKNYPKSYAAPFAMIAEARLIEAQGSVGEAKTLLESIGVSYPNTPAAMLAQTELAKFEQAKTPQQPLH